MARNTDEDRGLEAELEGLRRSYESLREQRVRLEQDQAHLARQLRELEDQAKAEFGSADPAELERLLAERRAENARLVSEYRKHLQTIEQSLAAIERQGSRGEDQ